MPGPGCFSTDGGNAAVPLSAVDPFERVEHSVGRRYLAGRVSPSLFSVALRPQAKSVAPLVIVVELFVLHDQL
jgi:hypothetical protein